MDFVSWLEGLPRDTATKLYASHWACQAILRGLPPIAKQYVLRLLFLDTPVPASAHAGALCLGKVPRQAADRVSERRWEVQGPFPGLTRASTLCYVSSSSAG
jgi:hypothetical protein